MEDEEPITSHKLKLIGEEIQDEFGFKSLDIQILINDVLELGLIENKKLKMFDCCCFIHQNLAYNLKDIVKEFSIQTGFYIFDDVGVDVHSSFLDNCLNFSQYLV